MFALEVLHAGRLEYRALLPALLGSLCASATSGALGLEKFQVAVAVPNALDVWDLLKVLALGAVFGLAGSGFAWLLARAKTGAAARLENPYLRAAVMGAGIAASLGCALAAPLGLDPALAAALGYVAVFGGATNTLLAPVLIGAEVFGYQILPLAFIACSVAYACNFNRTIYAGQIR